MSQSKFVTWATMAASIPLGVLAGDCLVTVDPPANSSETVLRSKREQLVGATTTDGSYDPLSTTDQSRPISFGVVEELVVTRKAYLDELERFKREHDELESFVAVSPFDAAEEVPVEAIEVSDAEFLSLRFYGEE